MKAHESKHSRLILFLLLTGLIWAVPAIAKEKEYPPTPPPKKTEPVTTDVKPLTDKPPAHPPIEKAIPQPSSQGDTSAKNPSRPPKARRRPPGNAEIPTFTLKNILPAPGTRVISGKPPERKEEVHKGAANVVIKQKETERLLPNVKQYFVDKYRNILEVTSNLQETPNGPAGSLKLEGNFLPENAYAINEKDRNSRAEAIANAFLEEEASFLGITNRGELRRSGPKPTRETGGDYININYLRYINGIRLDNHMIQIAIGPDETIHKVNAYLVPVPSELYEATTKEMMKENEIREIMEQNIKTAESGAENIKAKAIEKLAVPKPPYVTWQGLAGADLNAGRGSWEYRINAFTGELLEKRSGKILPRR